MWVGVSQREHMSVSRFDDLATARWNAGVRKFRDGNAELPFDGDPIAEGLEECLDLRNYAVEAYNQGRIAHRLSHAICAIAEVAFDLLDNDL